VKLTILKEDTKVKMKGFVIQTVDHRLKVINMMKWLEIMQRPHRVQKILRGFPLQPRVV
jgi:hypothetical protein